MKIEDPLSPSGDQPDLNKLRRTEQPLCVLGRKPVLRPLSRPGLLLWGRVWGESTGTPARAGDTAPMPPGHRITPHVRLLYWCCRLGERELEPGLEGRELLLGACRAWGSSCCPAALAPPVPGSSLQSFWALCCSGHSKWTQWNTSFAVLCVPTIRMKDAGRLSKVTDCQDLQETLVLSATMVHCCWLVETST